MVIIENCSDLLIFMYNVQPTRSISIEGWMESFPFREHLYDILSCAIGSCLNSAELNEPLVE